MKAEDREPLAQALFDAGYGVGEQVDIDRLKAKLAALGHEVRPIAERERYEALRRYRFATEGIEQAAEAAEREADYQRFLYPKGKPAAVAPLDPHRGTDPAELDDMAADWQPAAPLDVEALREQVYYLLFIYGQMDAEHGHWAAVRRMLNIDAAYADVIRKRDPDPTGGGA